MTRSKRDLVFEVLCAISENNTHQVKANHIGFILGLSEDEKESMLYNGELSIEEVAYMLGKTIDIN